MNNRSDPGRFSRVRIGRLAIAALVLGMAGMIWVPRQAELINARRTMDMAESENADLVDRISSLTPAVESARRELAEASSNRNARITAAVRVQQQLVKLDPDSQWAEPPVHWPNWGPASPYVWLSKKTIPNLPVTLFGEDGTLRSELGAVLDIGSAKMNALNQTLQQLTKDYRALQFSHVERVETPASGPGGDTTLTVSTPPLIQEGAGFKQQFEAALRSELGAGRADLILQTDSQWLDRSFDQGYEAGTNTITLVRHPSGSYDLTIKQPHGMMSTAGQPDQLRYSIPNHFLPLVSDFLR